MDRNKEIETIILSLFDAHGRIGRDDKDARQKVAQTAVDRVLRVVEDVERYHSSQSDVEYHELENAQDIIDYLYDTDINAREVMEGISDTEGVDIILVPQDWAEDVPESLAQRAIQETMQSLRERVREAESDSSPEETQEPAPDEEIEGSEPEPPQSGDEENDGRRDVSSGRSHPHKTPEKKLSPQEREEETKQFLREHEGEWVSWRDYREYAEIPRGTCAENVCPKALSRVDREEMLSHLETRADPSDNRRKQYRYNPPETDSEREKSEEDASPSEETESEENESQSRQNGKETYRDVPGTISSGTKEHEVLALLSALNSRIGPVSTPEMAEVGRHERQFYSNAMTRLKNKNLVEEVDEDIPTLKTTEAGEAEMNRVGGFQINANA